MQASTIRYRSPNPNSAVRKSTYLFFSGRTTADPRLAASESFHLDLVLQRFVPDDEFRQETKRLFSCQPRPPGKTPTPQTRPVGPAGGPSPEIRPLTTLASLADVQHSTARVQTDGLVRLGVCPSGESEGFSHLLSSTFSMCLSIATSNGTKPEAKLIALVLMLLSVRWPLDDGLRIPVPEFSSRRTGESSGYPYC